MTFYNRLLNLQIKKAEIEDANDILTIEKECRLSEWQPDEYRREIVRTGSLVLVAKVNSKAVGFILARQTIDEIDILNIGVFPEYQNLGIGSSLLNSALERIDKTLVEAIWLEVRESNLKAIAFYKKKGFKQIQIRKNFYIQPVENAVVMRCELKK